MNIAAISSRTVLNSMRIELADLKSADPQQAKQLQTQMQQQLRQLQQGQEQAQQNAVQPASGALIDVSA
jgi:hypothetical protein